MGLIVKMLTSFVRFFAERYGQPRRKAVGPHHIPPPIFEANISCDAKSIFFIQNRQMFGK